MNIHATAIVHPSAKLGKDIEIGPYAIIGENTVIGDRCKIGPHTVIEFTELGEECQVFPFASLGLPPQHLKYKGEPTKVVVGPRCVFRESVTVHRGTALDEGVTTIGSDGYFMAVSHIAHDCRFGHHVTMANAATIAGHSHIGDYAFISASVGIHQFVRVGAGAIVSGGAMVPTDVAPYCIAQGDRASIKGLNVVGLRRQGAKRENLKNLKEAYRTFFLSGLSLDEALKSAALNQDDAFVKTFREFLSVPKRGILRPTSGKKELAEVPE